MLPKYHILLSFLVTLFLYALFPEISKLGLLIFFLAGFLIDFDHYLYYLFKKRDFNPKSSIIWFKKKVKKYLSLPKEKRKKYRIGVYVFHGLEWIILFTLLGISFNELFLFVAGGMLFHLILDYGEILKNKKKLQKISIIYDLIKFKKLKKL